MKRTAIPKRLRSWILILLLVAVSCSSRKDAPRTKEVNPVEKSLIESTIKQGYRFKTTGENEAAMALFEKAKEQIVLTYGKAGGEYASIIDDIASVELRTGKTEEALKKYEQAKAIIDTLESPEERMVLGLSNRIPMAKSMLEKNIRCSEPLVPPKEPTLPYFPDVEDMQEALGKLNPYVAVCADGIPEAVTLRIFITGDGRAIHAVGRGPHLETPLAECVIDKLFEKIPEAELPPFGACYRGFTYPFMVGKHPEKH